METRNVITRKSYKEKTDELNKLLTEGRDDIAQRIKDARAQGDLSENAEYDEAMNDQAKLEAKIKTLEGELENCEIIETDYLNKVKVEDVDTHAVSEYIIITPSEAKPSLGMISNISPVGAALLRTKVDEIAEVMLPSGKTIKLKVLESEF